MLIPVHFSAAMSCDPAMANTCTGIRILFLFHWIFSDTFVVVIRKWFIVYLYIVTNNMTITVTCFAAGYRVTLCVYVCSVC